MEGRLFAAEAISQHRKRFNNSISTWITEGNLFENRLPAYSILSLSASPH
jgi:hypothetical protein